MVSKFLSFLKVNGLRNLMPTYDSKIFQSRKTFPKFTVIYTFWYLCIYVTAKKLNFPEHFRKESEYAETPC